MDNVRIQDVPTVIESAPARAQLRLANGCEWCSNCGHATNESSDELPRLVPARSSYLTPELAIKVEDFAIRYEMGLVEVTL
jgi:hypothetical protein